MIDGKVAFTGGINLADEYINAVVKYGYWKDAAIMMKGKAAWSFTLMFLQMWELCTNTHESYNSYLIIDDSMLSALTLAAKSGIDVRIITPYKWDKWIVHMTTRSYYRELIKAGVKIYEYSRGFLHAKAFVSDDMTATVGTTNLDFRSLYLHFECGAWLYNSTAVMEIKKDFLLTPVCATNVKTFMASKINVVPIPHHNN